MDREFEKGIDPAGTKIKERDIGFRPNIDPIGGPFEKGIDPEGIQTLEQYVRFWSRRDIDP